MRAIAWALALGLISYAAARIGVFLLIRPEGMAPFWFANGVVAAVLLRRPRGEWPLLLAATFIGFFINMRAYGFPLYPDAVYGLSNVIEPLLFALIVQRWRPRFSLDSLRSFGLLGAASLGSCFVGATIARLAGPINWALWYIDDLLGILLVAPTILVFWPEAQQQPAKEKIKPRRVVEFCALLLGMTLTTFMVFDRLERSAALQYSQAFMPFLFWAALRFRAKGACLACLWVAALTIAMTILGIGPFAALNAQHIDRSLAIQIFLAINLLSYLALGIALTEQDRYAEERLQLQQQVIVAQRMESLGTLAGGIAHDFNNILTAMIGGVRLAAEEIPANHPAQQTLSLLGAASNRAAELVDQISMFSRRKPPQRALVNLQQIVDEVIKLLRASLPAQIRIDADLAPEAVEVMADASNIHQVLMNLGTNAAHAMHEGGGTLSFRLVPRRLDQNLDGIATQIGPGSFMALSVTDTGCGIEAATLADIFHPFFTTKAPGEGTGLGLSVVLGIVKSHGGAITVETQVGAGSTFTVYLPAANGAKLEPVATAVREARGAGKHILLVEDEASLIVLITKTLEKASFKVSSYTDPQEALDRFKGAPQDFAALLTDLSMGRMSGLDLAREVMQIRKDLPVVLVSGYISPEMAKRAKELGIRAVMSKPGFINDISSVLGDMLTVPHATRTFQKAGR